ncbi:unnamed protein product [Vitrella brassicaformis CCMP3155]|uniref:Cytosolic fatty-acid binding proteins domain-containing protein n=1 Tax=Vitrella brassicaformis (strain CCMP3155) TaxID=1169540 RepID=A0A0G4EXS8_VITBC|nr:unnamed protein product [Vitrella brassicaformis CCMP3155]|eukprot:CEM03205.1 unnamed protein product [Vitrella brassicaformis CCMP3155]
MGIATVLLAGLFARKVMAVTPRDTPHRGEGRSVSAPPRRTSDVFSARSSSSRRRTAQMQSLDAPAESRTHVAGRHTHAKPDFSGKWRLVRNEGLEDFLRAQGYSSLKIRLARAITPVQVIRQDGSRILIEHHTTYGRQLEAMSIGGPPSTNKGHDGKVTFDTARWDGHKLFMERRYGHHGAPTALTALRQLSHDGRHMTVRLTTASGAEMRRVFQRDVRLPHPPSPSPHHQHPSLLTNVSSSCGVAPPQTYGRFFPQDLPLPRFPFEHTHNSRQPSAATACSSSQQADSSSSSSPSITAVWDRLVRGFTGGSPQLAANGPFSAFQQWRRDGGQFAHMWGQARAAS